MPKSLVGGQRQPVLCRIFRKGSNQPKFLVIAQQVQLIHTNARKLSLLNIVNFLVLVLSHKQHICFKFLELKISGCLVLLVESLLTTSHMALSHLTDTFGPPQGCPWQPSVLPFGQIIGDRLATQCYNGLERPGRNHVLPRGKNYS